MTDHVIGLDLGKNQDFTALTVVERTRQLNPQKPGRWEYGHAVRLIKRWPLGTSYTMIVPEVVKLASDPNLRRPLLAVDQTGVGNAVVDMLRQARPTAFIHAILITSGHKVTWDTGAWHVPKKELVSTLQVLLQTRRFKVAKLPVRKLLERELLAFRVKITTAATEVFEAWRERDHDDLVLAVALACWIGEQPVGPPTVEGDLLCWPPAPDKPVRPPSDDPIIAAIGGEPAPKSALAEYLDGVNAEDDRIDGAGRRPSWDEERRAIVKRICDEEDGRDDLPEFLRGQW